MKRRTFVLGLAAVPLAGGAAQPANTKDIKRMQSDWKTFLAAGTTVPPQAYGVLREENTERPGTSPLNNEKRPGVFVCAGCGLPLFTSEMKFESGTGWPSFFTAIPGAFEMKKDFHLIYPRTEYHCARCGGHHGHLFDDGPPPTNERWCNNGVALRFIPKG
jgi:peptide-methionine (R)-S-oxide reductase